MTFFDVLYGVGCTIIALINLYSAYRFNKIMKFIDEHPEFGIDLAKIGRAQKLFWVWPIRKVFEEC